MEENNQSRIEKRVNEIYTNLKQKGAIAEAIPEEEMINKISDYMLENSNISDKYLEQELSDLHLDNDQEEICRQVIHAYQKRLKTYLKEGQGAYLWASGNEKNEWGTGTGKTSLAVILLKTIIKDLAKYVYNSLEQRQKEALEHISFTTPVWEHNIFLSKHVPYYITGSDYFQDLNAADNQEKKRLKARAEKALILIWDDFGTGKIEWYHDEMFSLVNSRVENNKPIIFTSNWDFDIFAQTNYRKNNEKMKKRGGRLASRVAGMVDDMVFRMEGEDWRMKNIKNFSWD